MKFTDLLINVYLFYQNMCLAFHFPYTVTLKKVTLHGTLKILQHCTSFQLWNWQQSGKCMLEKV